MYQKLFFEDGKIYLDLKSRMAGYNISNYFIQRPGPTQQDLRWVSDWPAVTAQQNKSQGS